MTPPDSLNRSQPITADALRRDVADELQLLINEYDPINSDWAFRKTIIRELIRRLRDAPAVVTGEPVAHLRDEVRDDDSVNTEVCDKGDPGAYAVYRALPLAKAAGDVRAAVIEELAADFEQSVHHVWDNQEIADHIRAFGGRHG